MKVRAVTICLLALFMLTISADGQQRRRQRRREQRREHRRERRQPEPRATPWSGILDPARAIDWSTAGIPGGIPNVTTQCGSTLLPSGGDDTTALQAALNGCSATSNSYVQMAAGTFHTFGTVYIPTYVVLRGMGADQTIIQMDQKDATTVNGYGFIFGLPLSTSQPQYNRVFAITSNNSKGDTTVTVAVIPGPPAGMAGAASSISSLAVGQIVWIAGLNDWFPQCAGYPDTPPPTSHCINTMSDIQNATGGGGSAFNLDGPSGLKSYGQRAAGQMNMITAIDTVNNIITLQDPLVDSFRHPLQDWRANSPADPMRGFNYGMSIHPSGSTHVYVQVTPTYSPNSPGYCLTGPSAPTWPTDGDSSVTETVPGIAAPNIPCVWRDFGTGTDSIPRLMYWNPVVNVGLENLQIFGVNNLQYGSFRSLVLINGCEYCWVKGIEINRPVGFITQTQYSYHGQIEQNYYTSSWYHGSGTDSAIDVDSGSSGFLIQNNIFERTPEAVFTDNGGSGNVLAYNYALGNWGANSLNTITMTLLSHDAYPWFNLQEGNIISAIGEDGIHGGNALGTKFRNWTRGTTKICQPVSGTGLTSGLPTRPPVPTVATNAVGGTTSYTYAVELVVGGAQSVPSVGVTITNGPAALSSTTYNTITAPNVPNANVIVSTTPPPNAATDKCLIFRCSTAGCTGTGNVGTQIGSIACNGVAALQDTGQASTGVAMGGTGQGSSIVPGTITTCTPLGANNTIAGANAWLAYQGNWASQYGQYSTSFNNVGNVAGSGDLCCGVGSVSQLMNYPERRNACAICSPHCQNNNVTCGAGGTTCAVVVCGPTGNRTFNWLLDEDFGFGSGTNPGAWDTTLAQDTAFHCQNYYNSLQAVEPGDCPSTTVLPPSFYLSGKPSWWGNAHWPPIGSDVTGGLADSFGFAYNNPAKNCYENVMGGTDSTGAPFLTFNAAACYSAAPPTSTGNVINGRGKIAGHGLITLAPSTPASGAIQLPQIWVNNLEYLASTKTPNTINFPGSSTGGSWSCTTPSGVVNYGPYTANSMPSLNQAVSDAEACRNVGTNHPGANINIPPGSLFSSISGLMLAQSPGDDPNTNTNFIVLNSSTPLPYGRTVCSHGIQDNLSYSLQPGLRNLGCNAQNLEYQLGTQITKVPSGPFTFANGTNVNTSDYNDIASMWTVEWWGTNTNGGIYTQIDSNNVGAHHYAILNAEVRIQPGYLGAMNSPIRPGQGPFLYTSTSQIPRHLHFGYLYVHGDWTDAPIVNGLAVDAPTGNNYIPNAFMLDCIYCSVVYSYSDRNLRPGAEGHVLGFGYAQQIKLVHNWMEGASINHLTGGQANTLPLTGFNMMDDEEDRANRYTYPYSWLLAARDGFRPNNVYNTTGGTGTGARIAIATLATGGGGNVATVFVQSPGTGYAVNDVLTMVSARFPSAQGATVTVNSVGAGGAVTAVTVTTAGSGYANESFVKKNAHEHKTGRRVVMDGNIFENTDYTGAQGTGISVKVENIGGGGEGANWWNESTDFTITNNILRNACAGVSLGARSMPGAGFGSGPAMPTQRYLYRNNLMYNAGPDNPGCAGFTTGYGVRPANTTPGVAWTAMAQEDSTGTIATYTLASVPGRPGFDQSIVAVGDPIQVQGCSGGTNPSAFITDMNSLGPPAAQGTLFMGLTIVIPWTAPPNATATGCSLSTGQGWPRYLIDDHNSDFLRPYSLSRSNDVASETPSRGTVQVLARNITVTNGIKVNSNGFSSTLGEGTRTMQGGTDVNTLVVHHMIWSQRDALVGCPGWIIQPGGIDACYSAFHDDHTPYATPSDTIWGSNTPWCTTNDPTVGDCVGIVGMMNMSAFPDTLADWHQYRLCHTGDAQCNGKASRFAAGGANAAADGTDLGVDVDKINAAQTATRYCAACGSFPDHP